MPELSPNAALIRSLEQQLAQAGLQVIVERSEGALVLSGVLESEESRQAALDIVTQAAPPDTRIDDQLDIPALLPTGVDDFASDDPTAELADSAGEVLADGA